MSKLKRNIIQFTYDIEEFIVEIKEEISGKEYTNFSSDKKLSEIRGKKIKIRRRIKKYERKIL